MADIQCCGDECQINWHGSPQKCHRPDRRRFRDYGVNESAAGHGIRAAAAKTVGWGLGMRLRVTLGLHLHDDLDHLLGRT